MMHWFKRVTALLLVLLMLFSLGVSAVAAGTTDGTVRLQVWDEEELQWKETNDSDLRVTINIGESRRFRVVRRMNGEDVQQSLVNSSGKRIFHCSDNFGIIFLGDGTAEVYAVSKSPSNYLEYKGEDTEQRWKNHISIGGSGFVWYEINGTAMTPRSSNLDVSSKVNNSVVLCLKQGSQKVPLNPDVLRMKYGDGSVEFLDEYNIRVTVASQDLELQYFINGDTNMALSFMLKNNKAGPYFVSNFNKEHMKEYTFVSFADWSNDPQRDPGTLMVYMNGGPNGTILEVSEENISLEGDTDAIHVSTEEGSNRLFIRAVKNGTVTLKYKQRGYKEAPTTRDATLKLTVAVEEKGYALYSDNGRPLQIEMGSAYGEPIVSSYAIRLRELLQGVAAGDLTSSISGITVGEGYDDWGAANELLEESIWVDKDDDGNWTLYTRNVVAGEFHLPITVHVAGLGDLQFELIYVVETGDSGETYYYVSLPDSPGHKSSDFSTIQAALDAAAQNNNVNMRYVIIREGVYEAEHIDGEDGSLELHLQQNADYHHFSIAGEGEVVIKGSFDHTPCGVRVPIILSKLSFVSPDGGGTALTVRKRNNKSLDETITLQDVIIDGYDCAVKGDISAEKSRFVTIRNCDVGLLLQYKYNDGSLYVLRNCVFENNGTAIKLTGEARGSLKLRACNFVNNGCNIENKSSAKVNAAFNSYIYPADFDYDTQLAQRFVQKSDDSFSPYYRREVTMLRGAQLAYIDPSEMQDLLIDAKEADKLIATDNFGEELHIQIADIEDNGSHLGQAETYAVWNFDNTDVKAEVSQFNPLVVYELELTSAQAVRAAELEEGSYQTLSFAHAGDLPSVAKVQLHATESLHDENGDGFYLYKIVDGKLILQPEGVSYEGGVFTFERPTCSDYIITDTYIEQEKEELPEDGNDGIAPPPTQEPDDEETDAPSVTPTPTPPKQESADDDSDSNDYIPLSEVKNKLKNSSKDVVSFNVESRSQISAKAFEELAKYPQKTLQLVGDGYSLSMKGSAVQRKLNADYFDAKLRSTSPYSRSIRGFFDSAAELQLIHSDFHGMLPGTVTLKFKVQEGLKGKTLNCYHYNESTDELEAVALGLQVDKNGYVSFSTDHFSTYVLSDALWSASGEDSGKKVNPSTGA